MNSLAVFKENHAKEAVFHFRYLNPPTYAAIGLNVLPNWIKDGPFDPFDFNHRAIRPGSEKLKEICELHMPKVSDQDGMSRRGNAHRDAGKVARKPTVTIIAQPAGTATAYANCVATGSRMPELR